jgi:hypothetical protein
MMKTTMTIIAAAFFALGLAGCKEETKVPEAPVVTETAPVPTAPVPAPAVEPAP